jgi:hypothetical protein
LETIFKPVSNAKKHDLEQQFNHCTLDKETKSPDVWFAELEYIRLQLKQDHQVDIDDQRMITQIIYNTKPHIYDTTIAMIKRDINHGKDVNLQNVKEDLRQVFGTLGQSKKTETALLSGENGKGKGKKGKPFKGNCRLCGKKGHKSAECWDNEKNKDKRPKFYKSPEERKKSEQETANSATTNSATQATKTGNSKYHCNYCNKDGHTEDRCFKKKAESTAVMLSCVSNAKGYEKTITQYTFIADSGASSHMVNSKKHLTNIEKCNIDVKVGNSEVMKCSLKGTYEGKVIDKKGNEMILTLQDVMYVPELWVNLFSITKAIANPKVTLTTKDKLIVLKVNGNEIIFDKTLQNGSGRILAIDIIPTNTEYANVTKTENNYDFYHKALGHPNSQTVIQTANYYGITLNGDTKEPCLECALSKAKIKNIPKTADNKAKAKGERIFIDIASVQSVSMGGAKFWLLIQDEYTDYVWSRFLSQKSDVSNVMITWLKEIKKEANVEVKIIRCDNSGENRKLMENLLSEKDLNIKFEFTAPYTPQQNGKIERKFATLFGKVRSMLNCAKLTNELRQRL